MEEDMAIMEVKVTNESTNQRIQVSAGNQVEVQLKSPTNSYFDEVFTFGKALKENLLLINVVNCRKLYCKVEGDTNCVVFYMLIKHLLKISIQ